MGNCVSTKSTALGTVAGLPPRWPPEARDAADLPPVPEGGFDAAQAPHALLGDLPDDRARQDRPARWRSFEAPALPQAPVPSAPPAPALTALQALIFDDPGIRHAMQHPVGGSVDCAARVQDILNCRGIPNASRGVFIWNGMADETPDSHYAVLATMDDRIWVIDPAAGRFPGCEPLIALPAEWCRRIAAACFGQAVLCRDYRNLALARAGVDPLFCGSPLDFDGRVIHAPQWFQRIVAAPEAFRASRRRQQVRDDAELRRRVRSHARVLRCWQPSPAPERGHRSPPQPAGPGRRPPR